MAAFDEDQSDTGAIVVTAILGALIAGAIIYGFNRYQQMQTAFNIPSIERSVPSIVPDHPQI